MRRSIANVRVLTSPVLVDEAPRIGQLWVRLSLVAVDEPHLNVVVRGDRGGGNLFGTEPAQAHNHIHTIQDSIGVVA